MKKLKTPKQIIKATATQQGFSTCEEAIEACVKTAQRDALECAAENAYANISYGGYNYEGEQEAYASVDKSSILNLMPK